MEATQNGRVFVCYLAIMTELSMMFTGKCRLLNESSIHRSSSHLALWKKGQIYKFVQIYLLQEREKRWVGRRIEIQAFLRSFSFFLLIYFFTSSLQTFAPDTGD